MTKPFNRCRPLLQVSLLCLGGVLVLQAPAQELNPDQEFEFARALIPLGFPDYADKVVQQVLRLRPDLKDRATIIQAEILVSKRKFSEAEELVKAMDPASPKAQAISLAIGKGYYLIGEQDKARAIFEAFFKQYEGRLPTDADLLVFYRDSAYQFAQMLEQAGDLAGAVRAYDKYLQTKPDPNVARALMAKQAEAYVKLAGDTTGPDREKYLAQAEKMSSDLQWGGLDIWFGQSLITVAHAHLLRGRRADAQKFLNQNLDILKEIDEFIRTHEMPMSLSPMAGARFLLGELYQKDAEAAATAGKGDEAVKAYAKAITEFINVFAQYSDSDWGPKAGLRAQEVKKILEEQYGKQVKWQMDQKAVAQVSEASFRLADNLFRQKKYPEAVAEYQKILQQYPEGEASQRALANVLDSYIQMNDLLMIKATAEYLGERFGGKEIPAMAFLAAGKTYFDRKEERMYTYFYETYLKYFPQHDRAAAILFTLAGLRKTAGDEAGAAAYYERIVDNYPKDQYYPKALSAMAWGYFIGSNYAGAVKGFNTFLANAQPSPDKVQAQFALAESYRMLGQWPEALSEYEKLIGWLVPKDNPYATSAADAKKNADILEKAVFQRAFSYSRMGGSPEEIKENRLKGIRAYDQFIASFPNSTLASKALDAKGRMQLEIGQFDAAAKTFDELAAKYPTSDEGRNALFSLIRSAVEVKQYEQALSAFEKMYGARDKFKPEEFARVGQLMLDGAQYPQAVEAFQYVVAKVPTAGLDPKEERALLERALFGLGRAAFEQGQFAEASKAMEDLMKRYPKSGTFYEAKFIQARANKELNKLKEAIEALGDIMKYAEDAVLRNQTTYELARIQKQQGDKPAALASYLRVALLADPKNPALAELVEKSLLESIELGLDMERYQDVLDSCEQYMAAFPAGAKIEDVRRIRGEARLKAAAAAARPAVTNAPAAGK